MIEVVNLSKTYPNGNCALQDVTFSLSNGIVGLIGPNGAGKTTLMRILVTLLKPTNGKALIFGFDVEIEKDRQKIRNILAYLPQETGLHPKLTVEQNLDYFAILKRIDEHGARVHEIQRVLEQTGLIEVRRERAQNLSGGLRRRLGIAITLLNEPRVIIVDEPTAGLDPAERVRFRNVLAELAGERIVVLSSHIVQDIEQISSELIVLCSGQILFHGQLSDLIRHACGRIWLVEKGLVTRDFDEGSPLLGIQAENGRLMQRIISDNPPVPQAKSISPSLEDAYLYMMHHFKRVVPNR
jgi:ABC-2 type transport system ATP-binding protein